jgi:hypothetical protein
MTFVQDVPAGAIVFLDCGCRGHRLTARPDASVIVIVEQACASHLREGQPHVRQLDPLSSVIPFTRVASQQSA